MSWFTGVDEEVPSLAGSPTDIELELDSERNNEDRTSFHLLSLMNTKSYFFCPHNESQRGPMLFVYNGRRFIFW